MESAFRINAQVAEKMRELILKKATVRFPSDYQLIIKFNPKLRVSREKPTIVFGQNGSGKTILLEMLSGIFPSRVLNSGSIYEMRGEGKEVLEDLRIGFLPANPSLFFMHATVFEEFMSVCQELEQNKKTRPWYNWEQTWRRFAGYHPLTLSIGMQRMLIMDLLITRETDVFFLDEPLSSLDGREQILFFRKVWGLINDSKIIVIATANELIPLLFGSQARVFFAEVIETQMQKETTFTEKRIERDPFAEFANKIDNNASFENMVKLLREIENV